VRSDFLKASAILLLSLQACSSDGGSNLDADLTGDGGTEQNSERAKQLGEADGGGDNSEPAGPKNTTFRGPLNMGADPFMSYKDGFYYLATTQGDAVRMWKAPTVGGLLTAEAATVWRDDNPTRNREIWAPSFYFFDGKWYLYYTADDGKDDNHRLYVAESDGADALGPYHFKAKMAVPGADYWAIDVDILEQNGKRYALWSGSLAGGARNLLFIAPMSNPWTISGARMQLAASGGCSEVREGPSLLQHDGRTFMVYSACDTGKPDYQLWMKSIAMNADPMVAANWKQHAGAVMTRNDAAGVWGPGHNGFFKSPDGKEDWIVYHGKNTPVYTYDGRTTRIEKITWNGDGTPRFAPPPATGAEFPVPSGDPGGGPFWINDDGSSGGAGQVTFSGKWTAYPSCGVNCFKGDDHGTTEAGATATFTFTGTQIALLSVRDKGNGAGVVTVDDGEETTVDFYNPLRHGEQLIYVSKRLPFGAHTLKLRAVGGKAISVDRAEVSTQ
jgi:GH43 family beta-xylosidase